MCPFCGYAERDAWEINFGPGLDGETEINCGKCGKECLVERHIDVAYSTRAK